MKTEQFINQVTEETIAKLEAQHAVLETAAVALAQAKAEEVPTLNRLLEQEIEGLRGSRQALPAVEKKLKSHCQLLKPVDVIPQLQKLQHGIYPTQKRIELIRGCIANYLMQIGFEEYLPSQWQSIVAILCSKHSSHELIEFFNQNYGTWRKTWYAILDGQVTDEISYRAWVAAGCPTRKTIGRSLERLTRTLPPIYRQNAYADEEYKYNVIFN